MSRGQCSFTCLISNPGLGVACPDAITRLLTLSPWGISLPMVRSACRKRLGCLGTIGKDRHPRRRGGVVVLGGVLFSMEKSSVPYRFHYPSIDSDDPLKDIGSRSHLVVIKFANEAPHHHRYTSTGGTEPKSNSPLGNCTEADLSGRIKEETVQTGHRQVVDQADSRLAMISRRFSLPNGGNIIQCLPGEFV